jgi:hypothetical protein
MCRSYAPDSQKRAPGPAGALDVRGCEPRYGRFGTPKLTMDGLDGLRLWSQNAH